MMGAPMLTAVPSPGLPLELELITAPLAPGTDTISSPLHKHIQLVRFFKTTTLFAPIAGSSVMKLRCFPRCVTHSLRHGLQLRFYDKAILAYTKSFVNGFQAILQFSI
jgi:hypothetical protein